MIKKAVNMPVNFVSVLAFLIGLVIGLAATGLFELVKQRDGYTKEDDNNGDTSK